MRIQRGDRGFGAPPPPPEKSATAFCHGQTQLLTVKSKGGLLCQLTPLKCFLLVPVACADPHGGQGVRTPLKKSQNKGFLSDSGPDPLKNNEATEPAFNVGPSSARKRNAILIAFRWRADDGLLIVVLRSSHPSSTKKRKKKRCQSWTPYDKIFWIRAWDTESLYHVVKRYIFGFRIQPCLVGAYVFRQLL